MCPYSFIKDVTQILSRIFSNVDLIAVVVNAEMKVDYTTYTDDIKTNTY